MKFNIFVFAVVLFLYFSFCAFAAQEPFPSLELARGDRILILAPHPDDEVLGCAGIIQEAVSKDMPVRIVFFTYGDNNEWSFAVYRKHLVFMPQAVRKMGLMRHDEAIAAAKILSISPDNLVFLGYPDFGTMEIWCSHWGSALPFRSMLTKVKAVPYSNALRPGAPYKGEEILKDLKTILLEFKPTKIFVPHPGDHSGDHRSLYLFTKTALWDLEKDIEPRVCPYIVHFVNWPKPRGYYPADPVIPPAVFSDQVSWSTYNLSQEEIKKKENAIEAHHSQYISSAKYLLSFIRNNELFGDFPLMATMSEIAVADNTNKNLDMPEDLTENEKAAFVGVEERYLKLEDNNILFSIKFSKPLAQGVTASAYFFGYRADVPFQDMPKIRVEMGALAHRVYDQYHRLSSKSVKVVRRPDEITLYIPLGILKYPQRIMTSATSRLAEVPLDLASWRILYITDSAGKTTNDNGSRK